MHTDSDEQAVVAVHLGCAERLAYDRYDPDALLACRLGDQLLDPYTEGREPLVDDQRQLVTSGPHGARQHRAEQQPRVLRGRNALSACGSHSPRPVQQLGHIHAGEGRGYQAEMRQGGITTTEIGASLEHGAKAPCVPEFRQRRPGIGDDGEVVRHRARAPEVLEQRSRLRGGTRLRGRDEQRPVEWQLALDAPDRRRIVGIEHVKLQVIAVPVERAGDHEREQARPAHAEDECMREPVGARSPSEALQPVDLGVHGFGHGEPAEPVGDLGGIVLP